MIEDYRRDRENLMAQERANEAWLAYYDRYIQTYSRIVGSKFVGPILDIGCGTNGFAKACHVRGIEAEGIDIDRCDFEKDRLPYEDERFRVATMNALIEHVREPAVLLREVARVLEPGGLLFIRTPNWRMCFRDFYQDPTHVKPYTTESLQSTVRMYGFDVIFCEPGLICKSPLYWQLPNWLKWWAAKLTPGGTSSILLVGEKTRRQ